MKCGILRDLWNGNLIVKNSLSSKVTTKIKKYPIQWRLYQRWIIDIKWVWERHWLRNTCWNTSTILQKLFYLGCRTGWADLCLLNSVIFNFRVNNLIKIPCEISLPRFPKYVLKLWNWWCDVHPKMTVSYIFVA